jgi:hypothetical protein
MPRAGARPKSFHPLLKCQARGLCRRRAGAEAGNKGADPGGEEAAAGDPRRGAAAPCLALVALAPSTLFALKLHA